MAASDKVWFITGISRGLGKELAKAVAERGEFVVGTSRSGTAELPDYGGRLKVLPLDVTNAAQVKSTVAAAQAIFGRLDVVVNNAGYGLIGAVEEASAQETHDVFAVNFFGTLHVTQAALPFLRQQGRGHIVNITSIAGLAPMAGSGLYAAAKFAVEGMSQSLAEELRPLGIAVTLVEPGAFRTEFLSDASIQHTKHKIDAYKDTSGKAASYLASMDGKQLGDPGRGVQAIITAIESTPPPLQLVLGSDALQRTRKRLEQLTSSLNNWEAVSVSTDFSDAGTAR